MVNSQHYSPLLGRGDLNVLYKWIPQKARVLDLGCGGGLLLQALQQHKQVTGYGIELNSEKVAQCISRGVNVLQMDLDEGLSDFETGSFDYVILSLTLQAMHKPKALLREMLRVGENGIVTFPNFAYWQNRLQLSLTGKMPVSDELPFSWHDTPNIHLCTIRDFKLLCDELNFTVDQSIALSSHRRNRYLSKLMPNLFGEISLHRFSKQRDQ